MLLLSARAAWWKRWLLIPADWLWAGSGTREPGARRQTSVFVRGRGGCLRALNARCRGMRAAAAAVPGEPARR